MTAVHFARSRGAQKKSPVRQLIDGLKFNSTIRQLDMESPTTAWQEYLLSEWKDLIEQQPDTAEEILEQENEDLIKV